MKKDNETFYQWADAKNRYGVNFAEEDKAAEFEKHFREILDKLSSGKEMIFGFPIAFLNSCFNKKAAPSPTASSPATPPATSPSPSVGTAPKLSPAPSGPKLAPAPAGIPKAAPPTVKRSPGQGGSAVLVNRPPSTSGGSASPPQFNPVRATIEDRKTIS